MRTLAQLPLDLRRNVILASEDKDVQRLIVEAMFGCMERGDTDLSDITEYIEPDDITDPRVRVAVWGERDIDDEEW